MQPFVPGTPVPTSARLSRRAKRVSRERGISHGAALELLVRELGYPHWKAFLAWEASQRSAAPARHPIMSTAIDLDADHIHIEVMDDPSLPVRLRFRIHGRMYEQPPVAREVALAFVSTPPAEPWLSHEIVGENRRPGKHYETRVPKTRAEPFQRLRMVPRSLAVLEHVLAQGPGAVFVAGPGGRATLAIARSIFDHARSKAGRTGPSFEFEPGLLDMKEESIGALGRAVRERRAKVIAPLAGGGLDMTAWRLRESFGAPPELLAAPGITSCLVYHRSLQQLCPACSTPAPGPQRRVDSFQEQFLAGLRDELPGVQMRFVGPGCAACRQRGGVGFRHLITVKIATLATAEALRQGQGAVEIPWLVPEPGHQSTPAHNTIRAQALQAIAAGELDPLDVQTYLGSDLDE